jgi:hypothetical protein
MFGTNCLDLLPGEPVHPCPMVMWGEAVIKMSEDLGLLVHAYNPSSWEA